MFQGFRGHVEGRADCLLLSEDIAGLMTIVLLRHGESEVCQLRPAIGHEDIGWFDVSVYDVVGHEVSIPLDDVLQNGQC